ncbi:hypothetical protein FJNA_03960 [Thermus sp. FJN-A]
MHGKPLAEGTGQGPEAPQGLLVGSFPVVGEKGVGGEGDEVLADAEEGEAVFGVEAEDPFQVL